MMDTGIAVVREAHGRGVDFKFQKSSHVIIDFIPESMPQLHQMIGRSCRSMTGNHYGTVMAVVNKQHVNYNKEQMVTHINQKQQDGYDGFKAALTMIGWRKEN